MPNLDAEKRPRRSTLADAVLAKGTKVIVKMAIEWQQSRKQTGCRQYLVTEKNRMKMDLECVEKLPTLRVRASSMPEKSRMCSSRRVDSGLRSSEGPAREEENLEKR